ncbi:MAG TPA: hypothetical protein VIV11_06995 [Kofleriaceae bacterium]
MALGGTIAIAIVIASGCSSNKNNDNMEPDGGGSNFSQDGGGDGDAVIPPMPTELTVTLVPDGGTGMQRVNFAIPMARGFLSDEGAIKVLAGGTELPAARKTLAKYADDSLRSVQVQVDVDVGAHQTLTVQLGVTGIGGLNVDAVSATLTGTGNNVHPRVWALLPAEVLTASGVAGPLIPQASVMGTPLDIWRTFCDYDAWDTDQFLVNSAASRDVWLYDRVTAMYRGYAITGSLVPLRSAYREAEIYRAGMTISGGVATNIAVPSAQTDLKYYYAQNMALHYLLTGDDRYREAAEAVSAKIATMFNPMYDGGDRFWTERHAGFTLLAHEWALMVTDDQASAINTRAETAVSAFLATQATYPTGYTDPNARCFAHSATAHGEPYGYDGCSPWMSAILADALDQYGRRVGGTREAQVKDSLARLGRIIARDGRDSTGKPFYWMGVGTTSDEVDDYDEHWGEPAYIVALAYAATGKTEPALKQAADQMIAGLAANGTIPHTRSFNWQCRSAVMTPALLK